MISFKHYLEEKKKDPCWTGYKKVPGKKDYEEDSCVKEEVEAQLEEGLQQTLRKVVPGYAKRQIDKKMDDQKFGRTDVDKDANFYRYKKIQDKLKKEEVEHIDELSNDLLGRYKKAAGEQASAADKAGNFEKGNKRFKGIVKATTKQFDNDLKKEEVEIEEAKKLTAQQKFSNAMAKHERNNKANTIGLSGLDYNKHQAELKGIIDRLADKKTVKEGWKGQLAGGTAGAIAGTLAGAASPVPFGSLIGGALGGTGGQITGDKLGDGKTKAIGKKEVKEDVEAQFDLIESVVNELALLHNLDPEYIWEKFEEFSDEQLLEYAVDAKGHKSSTGGLTQKGVDAYNAKTGGNLKTAVTTRPSKLKAGSKAANRRKSFCARMSGVDGPMKKPNGEPTRKALALRKWNC